MFEGVWLDVRYACRSLSRTPLFTVFALVILAIAIGATTALFSVLDHVVIRPLAYTDPGGLVVVHEILPGSVTPRSPVNAAHFEEWRASARSFDQIGVLFPLRLTLSGASEPELIGGARVSASLFSMLGVPILLGRAFSEDEEALGRNRVAVLGHDLWMRRFGADAAIVGQQIRLDGEPYAVIGVLGPRFEWPSLRRLYPIAVTVDHPQIWIPLGLRPSERTPERMFAFACIARLRANVSLAQANAEVNAVQRAIGHGLPGGIDLKASVVPLHDQLTGSSRAGLELLFATAVIVFLVACVNISNLFLARGIARRYEFAIVLATGANRRRLLQQVLAESLILGTGAGLVAAAVIAPLLTRFIVTAAPADLPRIEQVTIDARVFTFAAIVSVLCAVIVGLLPAWCASTVAPMGVLKSVSRTLSDRSGARARSLLVALEVGASTTCLIVAGVLAASLANVLKVDAGFATERTIAGELRLPTSRYNLERAPAFLRALKEAAESIPGVVVAGISDRVPLKGEGGNSPLAPEGTTLPRLQRPVASLQLADASYFRTLDIPLVEGRLFEESDRQRTPVAVMAKSAAVRIWPGQHVIGKRFRIGPDTSPLIEIVGVVGDVRGVSLESSARPAVYFPYWHTFIGQASLIVRTARDPAAVVPALQAAIRRLDPEMAVPAFESIDQIIAGSVTTRRFQMDLALLFAMTALVLTGLGIYATLASATRQRTREIAVRVALGAKPAEIRWMILAQALAPVGAGIAAGFLLVWLLAPLLRGLLFGVSPADPRVFVVTTVVLGGVAVIAAYIPGLRATEVSPSVAMRAE